MAEEISPLLAAEQCTVNSQEASESIETSDDEDEEVEPRLKYERLNYDLPNILRTDAASCIAVHPKFIVLGSHWGVVSVLDHLGNNVTNKENQAVVQHTTTVNQISLDDNGEFVASCSDDGRIFIHGLYSSDHNYLQSFDRPIKAIAIDPNFYKSGNGRKFITGDEKLILHERIFLNRLKATTLHEGDGLIRNIKWKDQFVAWASDIGVRIYDLVDNRVITLIKRDHDSTLRAELYPCNLMWKDKYTLLVGWADTIKVCIVKQRIDIGRGPKDIPKYYVEITSMLTTEFYVCGIAPFEENLVVLCCNKEVTADARPQLRLIEPHLEDYNVISMDVLTVNGYSDYRCNDYHLDCLPEEKLYYIMCPKDAVVAKPRNADDHISWLLERQKFEEAMVTVNESKGQELKHHSSLRVGKVYLDHLLETQKYEEAARLCVKILGNDEFLWEEEVYKFAQIHQLKAIAPYLPYKQTQLSQAIYEMVLNEFLQSDYKGFHKLVKEWCKNLYSIPTVTSAVMDKLTYDPNNSILLHCVADLYTFDMKYDKALATYLKLGHEEVFNLIQDHSLFATASEHLEILMSVDKDRAVKMCLLNIDKLPINLVVKQLEKKPQYQYAYLDALFVKNPIAGSDFHERLIQLYAEYAKHKLMWFLRSSNNYPLQEALEICKQYALVPEQVFLLDRIGNVKLALQLITHEMNDIQWAIEFCKDHDDKDLWEDLIQHSLDKPEFIKVLLQNIGTNVDPMQFIQRINNTLEIPGLRDSLVKILQDFNLQISLGEGCKKIMVFDCFSLQRRLNKQQTKGIAIYEDQICQACNGKILIKDIRQASYIKIFYCRHAFHEDCLPSRNMDVCIICCTQRRGPGGSSSFHSS